MFHPTSSSSDASSMNIYVVAFGTSIYLKLSSFLYHRTEHVLMQRCPIFLNSASSEKIIPHYASCHLYYSVSFSFKIFYIYLPMYFVRFFRHVKYIVNVCITMKMCGKYTLFSCTYAYFRNKYKILCFF